MLRNSMVNHGEEQLTFLQEDFHASLLALPGSDEAKTMTALSGRKCLGSFPKSDQTGLLAKTLLVSSTWDSTIVYLTWKLKVTKRRYLYYQLVPSRPRIDATACGSSQNRYMIPTPTANPEAPNKNSNSRGPKTITEAINGFFRTPDANCNRGPSSRMRMRMRMKMETGLPISLNDQIAHLLPTPTQRDGKGANSQKHLDKERGHHDQLPNSIKMKTGLKLQPAFVLAMMGFPKGWLDLNQSEMPSSHKSHTKSSKRLKS